MPKHVVKKADPTEAQSSEIDKSIPRSMVFYLYENNVEPTDAFKQLVLDFRAIMQPYTAARLRTLKQNELKDFLVMAGPLGVSHLFVFSLAETGRVTVKFSRFPRGPTLYFEVLEYSLCKDVQHHQTRPHSLGKELSTPPVLVLNNFKTDKTLMQETILTKMFQNMLPAVNVQSSSIKTIKRVLMINKDPKGGVMEMRHYAVVTRVVTSSKAVKRILAAKRGEKKVPNLGGKADFADFLEDPNVSESENEDEVLDTRSENTNRPTAKKAVKLIEVGPRLRLKLTKIVDGVSEGDVLYDIHDKEERMDIKSGKPAAKAPSKKEPDSADTQPKEASCPTKSKHDKARRKHKEAVGDPSGKRRKI